MTVPEIFEACEPRPDVLKGALTADFAADLAKVVAGNTNERAAEDYVDPARFFANSYPTRGLKELLKQVCARLSGGGGEVASIFRLDTSYGGGKSHGLIALCHAARSGAGLSGIEEFVDPGLLPRGGVRVAAFDGENADPANGRAMAAGHRAFTPWGEIASALAGRDGYERVRGSDEQRIAPGAETLRELFGGEPTLILLDELSVYLRKVGKRGKGRGQLTAFLTSLIKAVEGSPRAALVYTLAIGKDGATDAYRDENQFIFDQMAEAEKVSARKATLLNPTEEDETIQVLRRRLFRSIDEDTADVVANAYRATLSAHRAALPDTAFKPGALAAFRASYPLHPEVLETLTAKTATLANFQRVRGMLRLLARTVALLWEERPDDATAIHLHHIDPGYGPIRDEIATRLGQAQFRPAISKDVSASPGGESLAERIDANEHKGLAPYASYAARTIFMHTLAFNESLKGLSPEQLRYSVLGPKTDVSFIDEARKKFVAESAYLDDRPGAPMRFVAQANLRQIIRRTMDAVEGGAVRAELDAVIRRVFRGRTLDPVIFPGGPSEVSDDIRDGRPKLVVLGYEAAAVAGAVEKVPDLVRRIFQRKGSEAQETRQLLNNLVFIAADQARIEEMRGQARRRLALQEMKRPAWTQDLAEYQRAEVRELEARSEKELAVAVQRCYRHLFYPSPNRVSESDVYLAHTAVEIPKTAYRPGVGERHVVLALRDQGKLRSPGDDPDSPDYVRDRTPLRHGKITTEALRAEFRRDPALPILLGDDVFVRGIRMGVKQGKYVYRRGKLLFGPGDPPVEILIDRESEVFTMGRAEEEGVWPRPPEPPGPGPGPGPEPPEPPPIPPPVVTAEGPLPEARAKLLEKVEGAKMDAIEKLTIRTFAADATFKMFGTVGREADAELVVSIEGGCETRGGSNLSVEFEGSMMDAQAVREFLRSQLLDAASENIRGTFKLAFEEGLQVKDKKLDHLLERVTRFVNKAANIFLKAEAKK